MNISALLIARNEQDIVKNCLESLTFADEIIVILDRSVDDTKLICKKYTKRYLKEVGSQKVKEETLVLKIVIILGSWKLMLMKLSIKDYR